jgi:propionyl-CoA carboxylase alpha chain
MFLGTRWVVNLDGKNFPITVRPIDSGFKVTFENRRLYIKSNWVFGNKLFECTVNGLDYSMQIEKLGITYSITFMGRTAIARVLSPRAAELNKHMVGKVVDTLQNDVVSAISGLVSSVKVVAGDQVVKGLPLLVVEAMKMENIITSPRDGIVKVVNIKAGENIAAGQVLIEIQD